MTLGAASSTDTDAILATARGCVIDLLSAGAWNPYNRLAMLARAEALVSALRALLATEQMDRDTNAKAAELLNELQVALGEL